MIEVVCSQYFTKICSTCRQSKQLEDYSRRKTSKDGRTNECKACVRTYYDKNKDKILTWYKKEWLPKPENQVRMKSQRKKWATDNPVLHKRYKLEARRRRRARLHNVECTLTNEEWEQQLLTFNNCCAYCHQPSDKLEQEHMLPISRGGTHALDNVVPACSSCNRHKSAKTILEFIQLAS